MAAVGALIAMSAERSRTATRDGIEHLACGQVNDVRSRNLLPAVRITSATSKGGRVIPVCSSCAVRSVS